jgi:hypothetical protein
LLEGEEKGSVRLRDTVVKVRKRRKGSKREIVV